MVGDGGPITVEQNLRLWNHNLNVACQLKLDAHEDQQREHPANPYPPNLLVEQLVLVVPLLKRRDEFCHWNQDQVAEGNNQSWSEGDHSIQAERYLVLLDKKGDVIGELELIDIHCNDNHRKQDQDGDIDRHEDHPPQEE